MAQALALARGKSITGNLTGFTLHFPGFGEADIGRPVSYIWDSYEYAADITFCYPIQVNNPAPFSWLTQDRGAAWFRSLDAGILKATYELFVESIMLAC